MSRVDSTEYWEYEVHYIDKKWAHHVDKTTDYDDAIQTLDCMWKEFAKGLSHKMQYRAMGNFYIDKIVTTMADCIEEYQLLPEE